ncbi:MAG TPA: outer membrane lipoprotein-sorting protein [Ignavibacteriaceae bacterium]|nr:outer membrane lipoprotein-sorting protein [Ignavibacteriaceae bacterium]
MTIVKPDWSRTMGLKIWSLEPEYALIYVTEPARDKGTVTLKRKNEVWNWIPSAQKVIKIPPSMMMQSWMGSDFTNDDLVKQSSIVDDYTHKFIGEENIGEFNCWKIQLTPKPEAGVVWGKIVIWISKKEYFELKADYYDEDGNIVKTFTGGDPQKMDDRTVLTHWEMVPVDEPGNKTILDYDKIEFNIATDQSFFSEQNMKRVR